MECRGDRAHPTGPFGKGPVPVELLERRVELLGGCSRQEIIQGMNCVRRATSRTQEHDGQHPASVLACP